MSGGPVLARIATLSSASSAGRGLVLVGIGGRGASGKSTLARSIPGAQVVGTDEFWDGTGFELSRLRSDVFEPLLHGEPASYRAFCWRLQRPLEEPRVVLPQGVIVVEGVCALHTQFRDDYDLRVWVDAPRELRLARALEREGEDARAVWETRWMPAEDRYIERDDPISAAQLLVDGSDVSGSASTPSRGRGRGSRYA
jgi:cytidylate kinase